MARLAPPAEVRRAFDLGQAALCPLPGGEGTTWRAGDVILKPVADLEEAQWIAGAMEEIVEEGFRVPRPVRCADGAWSTDGWVGWTVMAGEHDVRPRWPDVLRAGEAFHAALRGLARPAFIDRRRDHYATGDRVAWEEETLTIQHQQFAPLLNLLASTRVPVALPSQIIHGDLPGNMLFADALPPAIIDFSPYWRPAGWALAIVIADAIAWYEAPPSIIEHVAHVGTSRPSGPPTGPPSTTRLPRVAPATPKPPSSHWTTPSGATAASTSAPNPSSDSTVTSHRRGLPRRHPEATKSPE